MRAIAIQEFGGPDKLQRMDLPRPRAGKGEVLLRVVSAGVNPVDWKIREGRLEGRLPHRFPLIPGWDVAGVVEELGEGVSGFRKGDRVWGLALKPVVQMGCYAEYVALPETSATLMPAKLLYEEAAAVPLAALTAWQALFGRAGLAPGAIVLVQRAAGGVGHFAVQLARGAGCRVIGTAGQDNRAFVIGLGAEAVVDSSCEPLVESVRRHAPDGVDLVLDSVGGDSRPDNLDVLKPGGRLVSLVDEPDAVDARERGVVAQSLFVSPDAEQLRELARRFDHRKLRVEVQKIFPLAEAAEAHAASEAGHVRGKLVLNL